MTNYITSQELINALMETRKAPDTHMAYPFALGMAWAFLTEEQKAACIRVAKA